MSEHDRSHPAWVVPPAGSAPDPGDGASTASRTAAPGRRGRWLIAVALGSALLLGGGVAGAALAAEGGPDLGFPVSTIDDGDGRGGPGGDRGRGD